ncbi:enoyl-CoA hydratase/isomerase family protein [Nakamurella antarctica]|uniref:Enoyl-CoA hydratase/isomerase family protein n=1 Tax=Nakamurella antarctica TaxID=1902245 RepID=A0A3G8ZQF1_9ACTN|nr:enoyl-CoA hydratase/isomerase family protein [Nakamurella antarctica]
MAAVDLLLEEGHVGLDVEAGIATVTLHRPAQLNAQTDKTWEALAWIGENLDDTVRVVIVKGVGRSFSAGLDREAMPGILELIAGETDTQALERIRSYQKGFSWLADTQFVSIAAVHGHAIGAGFQLALACDLVIAATDSQFAMREITWGMVPDLGGTSRLTQAVGARRALELCATGRAVGAKEAWEIGLVNTVVDTADLSDAVNALAQELLSRPAEALRAVTRLISTAASLTSSDQRLRERSEQVPLLRELNKQTESD